MRNVLQRTNQTLTTPHVEVSLRMTLSMFIGYILLFANISWITPNNTARLMSILIVILVMLYPTLMFSFGAVILPTFSTMLYACISSTMLLAIAAKGGTAAYVCSFGIWAFWNCWLRWDVSVGSRVSISLILVVFTTLLGWPNFVTVQNGFEVPSDYLDDRVNMMLGEYLFDTISLAQMMGIGSHDLTVSSGVLDEVSVTVTVNEDGTTSTYVEGGMWMVTSMWTASGLNNPLAVVQSNLIMICWLIVVVSAAVLLPPFRTMRSAVWRKIIPAALKAAANMIRLQLNIKDTTHKAASMSSLMEEIDDDKEKEEIEKDLDELGQTISNLGTKITQLKGTSLFHMNTSFNGKLAKYTFFEPRLLDCKPVECTALYLADLSHQVGRMVGLSVGFNFAMESEESFQKMNHYMLTASNLDICANALSDGDIELLDEVNLDSQMGEHDVFDMFGRTSKIVQVSRKWLTAMNGKTEQSAQVKSFKMNMKPWVMVHFRPYLLLFQYLLAPFKRSTWASLSERGFHKLVWCFKYSLGMCLMMTVTIFWPSYSEGFAIAPDEESKQMFAIRNGGWTIIAYCFVTTQTAEGSIKKGILRFLGTLIGAFSGWLALVACEDSKYDKGYNPFGLVAWMTITSFISVYAATERGFKARISINSQYGFAPLYFAATQVIIVNTVPNYGPESRDYITVNRLVANLVGIAASMILAVVPPGNYGGDSAHARRINHLLFDTIQTTLESLVSCDIDVKSDEASELASRFKSLSNTTLIRAAALRDSAVDFQKDAERLQTKPLILPCFKVDERLKDEISKITRDIYVTVFIINMIPSIIESPDGRKLLLDKDGAVLNELKEMLKATKSGIRSCSRTMSLTFDSQEDTTLLIHTIQNVTTRIVATETALDDIKWGIGIR